MNKQSLINQQVADDIIEAAEAKLYAAAEKKAPAPEKAAIKKKAK